MRVLIDTNILVSAALKDKDPETVILFVAGHLEFEWIASPEIIEEYKAVLSRDKFSLSDDLLHRWFSLIDEIVTVIEVDAVVDFPRDQKDAKFLACAVTTGAEYFITGDRDFTEAKKIGNTTIISVSLFKKHICDAWPGA